jgi:hypothetical protein
VTSLVYRKERWLACRTRRGVPAPSSRSPKPAVNCANVPALTTDVRASPAGFPVSSGLRSDGRRTTPLAVAYPCPCRQVKPLPQLPTRAGPARAPSDRIRDDQATLLQAVGDARAGRTPTGAISPVARAARAVGQDAARSRTAGTRTPKAPTLCRVPPASVSAPRRQWVNLQTTPTSEFSILHARQSVRVLGACAPAYVHRHQNFTISPVAAEHYDQPLIDLWAELHPTSTASNSPPRPTHLPALS